MKLAIVSLLFLVAGRVSCDWWDTTVLYQVYPRSFKDSNNDGIGDIPGIESKLEHLADAGVSAIWLSPVYKSPMADMGYDISDFKQIHEEFGTMEDLERLIEKARKLGIRIVMDFVPNHTSDQHDWFKKSAAREPGFEDFYIWLDGAEDNTKPPNNWRSHFHGSAWEFHPERKQWYLHQFAVQQPDLNYRNPKVVEAMDDVITFWLDKGVGGFRMDAVPTMVETEGFPDEPLSNDPNATPDDHTYLNHIYTYDQPETYDIIYHWRALIDKWTVDNQKDETRVIMTESYSEIHKLMKYYGNETTLGAHFTFNFLFITDLNENSTARDVALQIEKWMTYMPTGRTANWVLGNHDQHRYGSRFGANKIDGLAMLQMSLPGVAVTYNGDEFAQLDGEVTYEQGNDPQGCNAGKDRYPLFTRDPERTPLQWDTSINAGFNEGHPTWLPVSDKYHETNLADQLRDENSHYKVYRLATSIKNKSATLQKGELAVKPLGRNVLTLSRELQGSKTFIYVFNLDETRSETVDLAKAYPRLSDNLQVIVASLGSKHPVNTVVGTSEITLEPTEALIMMEV